MAKSLIRYRYTKNNDYFPTRYWALKKGNENFATRYWAPQKNNDQFVIFF